MNTTARTIGLDEISPKPELVLGKMPGEIKNPNRSRDAGYSLVGIF